MGILDSFKSQNSLIFNAISEENYQDLNTLLSSGKKIDITYQENDESFLSLACKKKNVRIVEKVLSLKFPQNTLNTAILISTSLNSINITELLIDNGANPNFKSLKKATPLNNAIKNKNIELMLILLDNGASADKQTLDLAISEFKDKNLPYLLLSKATELNLPEAIKEIIIGFNIRLDNDIGGDIIKILNTTNKNTAKNLLLKRISDFKEYNSNSDLTVSPGIDIIQATQEEIKKSSIFSDLVENVERDGYLTYEDYLDILYSNIYIQDDNKDTIFHFLAKIGYEQVFKDLYLKHKTKQLIDTKNAQNDNIYDCACYYFSNNNSMTVRKINSSYKHNIVNLIKSDFEIHVEQKTNNIKKQETKKEEPKQIISKNDNEINKKLKPAPIESEQSSSISQKETKQKSIDTNNNASDDIALQNPTSEIIQTQQNTPKSTNTPLQVDYLEIISKQEKEILILKQEIETTKTETAKILNIKQELLTHIEESFIELSSSFDGKITSLRDTFDKKITSFKDQQLTINDASNSQNNPGFPKIDTSSLELDSLKNKVVGMQANMVTRQMVDFYISELSEEIDGIQKIMNDTSSKIEHMSGELEGKISANASKMNTLITELELNNFKLSDKVAFLEKQIISNQKQKTIASTNSNNKSAEEVEALRELIFNNIVPNQTETEEKLSSISNILTNMSKTDYDKVIIETKDNMLSMLQSELDKVRENISKQNNHQASIINKINEKISSLEKTEQEELDSKDLEFDTLLNKINDVNNNSSETIKQMKILQSNMIMVEDELINLRNSTGEIETAKTSIRALKSTIQDLSDNINSVKTSQNNINKQVEISKNEITNLSKKIITQSQVEPSKQEQDVKQSSKPITAKQETQPKLGSEVNNLNGVNNTNKQETPKVQNQTSTNANVEKQETPQTSNAQTVTTEPLKQTNTTTEIPKPEIIKQENPTQENSATPKTKDKQILNPDLYAKIQSLINNNK